ncbi:HCLS1-associated protein X-1 [Denticeps clupeoides]|uniref:HCLS1-associated protein X-1 n=1 Tax=Denticeps clupeoides TaxID=299321 RepID=A0AAY4D9Z9_9TELE|nr:HCLS1-associated protein X-1 [Denticeps clupeoides]
MSVFDLFRGFFGLPGGYYRGDGPRDPLFSGLTHDEEEDDDDEVEGFQFGMSDGFREQDPFDDRLRFGFSFGPGGTRFHEPRVFGEIFREMEEIFSGLGHWEEQHGRFGIPSIGLPTVPESPESRAGGWGGNSLRDFMLKSPDSLPSIPPPSSAPSGVPRGDDTGPHVPNSPFHHWRPFSKFHDLWKEERLKEQQQCREDGDLDSQVSSGGLDKIFTPPSSQPRTRSFFQSVTVTKVVKPDGTIEERRTVRDGQGKEESTVTRSGPQDSTGPFIPDASGPRTDLQDGFSLFHRFFGGFRG